MKKLSFYLFSISFLLTGSLSACPDCMGKVDKQSPSFFDEELYTTPSMQDNKHYQLNPYPYQYQLSPDEEGPSLDMDDDDDDLY